MPLRPQLPPPDYFMEIARTTLRNADRPERSRAHGAITLRRRFRGHSKSDQVGFFSPNGTNQWLGDRPGDEMYTNLHILNITKPTVRANQNAMVSAKVKLRVEPASRDLSLKGAASIAEGIAQWMEDNEDHWGSVLENRLNQMTQLEPGAFVRTYYDREGDGPSYQVEEWSDQEISEPGEGVCANCAKKFPIAPEVEVDADLGMTPCPYCKQPAEVVTGPGTNSTKVPQQQTYKAGEPRTDVVSTYEIRIDERRSQGGNMRRVEWLEHHFLEDEDELQCRVGDNFALGAPQEWSFPLKWQYALETGNDQFLKRWSPSPDSSDQMFEVRRIYLRPKRYRHYVSPVDWQMQDGNGKVVFSIRAGQRLTEIYPRGFYFEVTGDVLLPCFGQCDLQKEWTYFYFLQDSASFWGLPCSEILQLQDDVNNLYTIDIQQRERGAVDTTVIDRDWFDLEDFEVDLTLTKEGAIWNQNGDDIRRHFAKVPPPNLGQAMAGTEFILSKLPSTVAVQPAMLGEPSGGREPYAAQLLQRQSSLGMLTSSQQSKASGKCNVLRNHCRIAQDERPLEWFNQIQTRYGMEWTQEDVQTFLNCDVDNDLKIFHEEGSEMPATLIEREMRFRQFITDMSQLAAAIQRPDLITLEMVSQMAQFAGVSYDIGNADANERLANARMEKIKEHMRVFRGNLPPQFPVLQLALADPDLKPLLRENHDTHIEFYSDQQRALATQATVDHQMIAACEEMIKRHDQAKVMFAQNMAADALAARAPEIAAEQLVNQQATQQTSEQQQGVQQQKDQSAAADRDHKSQEAELKRQHDLKLKVVDHIGAIAAAEATPPPSKGKSA